MQTTRINLKEFIEHLNKILKEHGDIHVAFYDGYEEAVSMPHNIEGAFKVFDTTDDAIKATYTKDWNFIERAVFHKEWDKDSKVLVIKCWQ